MASLRDVVRRNKDELRDGIAWVAFWKEGRSWQAEYFYLECEGGNDDTLCPEDKLRLEEIQDIDPSAVILNGYYCGYLGKEMNVNELVAGVRWHYENGSANDISDFIHEHKKVEAEAEESKEITEEIPRDILETDKLRDFRLDKECKAAIEDAIRQNFDGMRLKDDIIKPLVEQYGSERMAFVLANTLQQEAWDGRFSRDNKAWSETIMHGMDINGKLVVSSHPAVLDGFIHMFRKEIFEQEKEQPARQEENQAGTKELSIIAEVVQILPRDIREGTGKGMDATGELPVVQEVARVLPEESQEGTEKEPDDTEELPAVAEALGALIIPIPASCAECKYAHGYILHFCSEKPEDDPIADEPGKIIPVYHMKGKGKPDWCPIRAVPDDLNLCGEQGQSLPTPELSYRLGWNTCKDAIVYGMPKSPEKENEPSVATAKVQNLVTC